MPEAGQDQEVPIARAMWHAQQEAAKKVADSAADALPVTDLKYQFGCTTLSMT